MAEKIPEKSEPSVAEAAAIRSKLSGLADRFTGFEHQLDQRKQQKKDDADKKIAELHKEIDELKASMLVEKQNQAMAMKAMQSWLQDMITSWTTKFERPYQDRFESIEKKIDQVNDRIGRLEQRVEEDRRVLPGMIDERAKELLAEITDFRKRFEVSQSAREEKEAALLVKIVEQDNRFKHLVEAERLSREQRIQLITQELSKETDFRNKGFDLIRKSLAEEVAALKVSISKETEVRSATDEELVQAIRHYAAALQDGIKIVADQ